MDMYGKIEKKILELKQKEEFWKKGYRELSEQVKELVESDSRQMKAMDRAVEDFQARMEMAEKSVRMNDARSAEALSLIEKRLAELSETTKSLSARIEEKGGDIKAAKADVLSQVAGLIARHEKTFDTTVDRIGIATKTLKDEFAKQEGLYDRMESAKRFFENYRPPQIPVIPSIPSQPPEQQSTPPPDSSPIQVLPPPPIPERTALPQAFIYEPQNPPLRRLPPRTRYKRFETEGVCRRLPAIDYDPDLDGDLDDDDIISEKTESIKDSVSSMKTGVGGISQKLASIEDSFSRMQAERAAGVERLEDKIRVYTQSVADIHSRMGMLEKAMKDGMTPMMEAMKMLTETVKGMKENAQKVPKPSPPESRGPGKVGTKRANVYQWKPR